MEVLYTNQDPPLVPKLLLRIMYSLFEWYWVAVYGFKAICEVGVLVDVPPSVLGVGCSVNSQELESCLLHRTMAPGNMPQAASCK